MSGRITVRRSSSLHNFARTLVLTTGALFALSPLGALAQQQQQSGDSVLVPGAASSQPDVTSVQNSTMSLGVGRSQLVKTPFPAKTISVVDKKIADVQVISPTQLLVSGTGAGTTDIVLYNAEGQAQHIEVVVSADRSAITAELKRILPGAQIDVRPSRDAVVITGTLSRAEDVDRLAKYMKITGVKYVDLTTVPGVQQVQIKVVVAEASRIAIRALGMNVGYSDDRSFAAGNVDFNQFGLALRNDVHVFGDRDPGGNITMFGRAFIGNTLLEGFASALAENQYMRVLAEPSLVALSGEEASFLAGGEFPIPVVQGGGSSNGGSSITITYKRFGVQLKFRPTVTGDGNIRLHVAPEVSELSNVGALQIEGFSIPGISTRRAETTLQVMSGQTFGMAGLISRNTQARASRVPALGDLPVLGALFRSVRYQEGDTELVLLVTASLVEPMSLANRPPLPSEFHVRPTDWEVYALARTEGEEARQISVTDAQWLRRSGLDRLRGPGAWATFENRGAVGSADVVSASQGVGSANTGVIPSSAASQSLDRNRAGSEAPPAAAAPSAPMKPANAGPTTRPSGVRSTK